MSTVWDYLTTPFVTTPLELFVCCFIGSFLLGFAKAAVKAAMKR